MLKQEPDFVEELVERCDFNILQVNRKARLCI